MTTMSAKGYDDDKSLWFLAGTLALSITAHVVTMLVLPEAMARTDQKKSVEMEFYEPPPPPPPPKVEEPEPPKPVEKVKVKPPPVKLAEVVKPKEDVPPPPNEEPPPETPQKPVPIIVGISMSSTTQAGGFAVQVGNTTYGKTSDKIVDAAEVKAYRAPKYVPPGGADTDPVLLGASDTPPYPEDAKRNEIEGPVQLKVTIDHEGKTVGVTLINGPGYGLNEAARKYLLSKRWKPATKGGENVGTTLVYTVRYVLD